MVLKFYLRYDWMENFRYRDKADENYGYVLDRSHQSLNLLNNQRGVKAKCFTLPTRHERQYADVYTFLSQVIASEPDALINKRSTVNGTDRSLGR